MNIDIIEYSKICASYRLDQPSWLKATLILVAIGGLALTAYLAVSFPQKIMLIIGLTITIIVFGVGFVKQRSSGTWHALLANKKSLYIIASVDGTIFLQTPWGYLQEIKLGLHGLNTRGLIINIKSSLLTGGERDLIRQYLNVIDDNASQITLSIPTGIVNRDRALLELKTYQ